MFQGSIVALITPFTKNNNIDVEALHNFIHWHRENHTDAIVLCGTTGESPTLSFEEKLQVFTIGVKAAEEKIPIIAGSGTNCTKTSVLLTQRAKEIGADGCMAVVPYYNRPTQEGCLQHFTQIAKVGLPTVVYHHPKRTGTLLPPQFFLELEKIPNISAIKEASCDMKYFEELHACTSLDILSGDDYLTLKMMQKGAKGVISVIANILPDEWKQFVSLCQTGNFAAAENIHKQLQEIIACMAIETNPQPVKYALSVLQRCQDIFRLPLVSPSEISKQKIKSTLETYLKSKQYV